VIAQALALAVLLAPSRLPTAAIGPRRVCADAQESRGGSDIASGVQRAYAAERWEDVVRLTSASAVESPDLDYYRGMALARLGRWPEAKRAFEAGRQLAPHDKRFPLELAGVAYKQQDFRTAKADLHRALLLDPSDRYAHDFLATVYLLEGNLPAALKYWNPIGKPRIEDVKLDPQPHVNPVLLDHAFAFAPASVLQLDDLRTTEARLDSLDIFPSYRFDLAPREDQSYDLTFRPVERDGWGSGKAQALVSLFRGVPYQTIYPEVYNLKQGATNFVSLLRWDAQKRRAYAAFSRPWGLDPKWRYAFHFDGRDETWNLSQTFFGSGLPLGDLRMRWAEAGAEITSVESSRWSWTTGVDFSHRDFHNFPAAEASSYFTRGFALKYDAALDVHALDIPERRLTVDTSASGQLGKMFVHAADSFAKLTGDVRTLWFPQARGDDYETTLEFRAGETLGQPPFDELFILGMERDNDLWLRAHVGTRDGKKGSAPLGRDYLLTSSDIDKIVYQNGFLKLKLGPFLDSGRIYDPSGSFGSGMWLWDTGGRTKIQILAGPTVMFVYGKDLRTGRNAYYFTVMR
jgi:tetratricopeptide (TPR) repeat protein